MFTRLATAEDLPTIVGMCEMFHATTHYAKHTPFDWHSTRTFGEYLLREGVLVVAEDGGKLLGAVALVVGPQPFNLQVKMASEVMWWVDPNARDARVGIALLEAVEPACKAKGARTVQMMTLPSSPPHAAVLYERLGFTHSETSYTKGLE